MQAPSWSRLNAQENSGINSMANKTNPDSAVPTREQLLEYTEALEGVNTQLVIALKKCLKLLTEAPPEIADKKQWKRMLDDFNKIAEIGERITNHDQNKNLH